jgi:peptidoglycan/LPS O-acetylase OafA/YrhL
MNTPVQHRQSMDLARFIAAFGVVVAHAYALENDWVGHLSLGLFLILTAFLAVQSMQRAGGTYPFVARAKRLVVPWLIWSLFYRLVMLKVVDGPEKYAILSDPWSLLTGSAIHLWFLPFVMLAMVMVEPAGRFVTSVPRLAVALTGLALVSAPMLWLHQFAGWPQPMPQWLIAFPVYALGLGLGLAHPLGKPLWPVLAAAVMTLWAYFISGGALWSATILTSILLFEAFWRLPLRGKWLPMLGQSAFGIYLIHPFFMLVTYKLFGADVMRMQAAVVTFLLSWAAVLLFRRVPVVARFM